MKKKMGKHSKVLIKKGRPPKKRRKYLRKFVKSFAKKLKKNRKRLEKEDKKQKKLQEKRRLELIEFLKNTQIPND